MESLASARRDGMSIVLARVDNRLVHGQVLEAWVPRCKVQGIVVVDAELSADPLCRTILEALGRGGTPVELCAPEGAKVLLDGAWRDRRVLVLFAGVPQARAARRGGVCFGALNLGNIHPRPGSRALTPSVYLTPEDEEGLLALAGEGVDLDARAVPTDRSPDILAFLSVRS